MKRFLIATIAVVLYTLAPTGSMFAPTTARADQASLQGQTPVQAKQAQIPSVTIEAVENLYKVPVEIPAGIVSVTLHNMGKNNHNVLFIRVRDGKTRIDLSNSLGDPARVEIAGESFGGVGRTPPGQSRQAVLDLQEGDYLIIGLERTPAEGWPDVAYGMQAWIKVVANSNRASAPRADVVASIKDGAAIALPAVIPAGTHIFEVRSEGPSLHRLIMVKLQPGKTMADFTAWVDAKEYGPPPSTGWDGPSAFSAGKHGWFTTDLTPGEYVVFCSPSHPDPYDLDFLAGEHASFTVIAQAPEGTGMVKAGSGALQYIWLLVPIAGLLLLTGFKMRSQKRTQGRNYPFE